VGKDRHPVTPAIRALRAAKVDFVPRLYEYVEKGGTRHSSAEIGMPEHAVIKTIVLQTDEGEVLLVLMHGDRKVSTKQLARHLGVKSIEPCTPEMANKHTGYIVGGTSPFGTRRNLPVYMQASIIDLDRIAINGGKRGFLVELDPADIGKVVDVTPVDVAVD